MGFLRGGSVLAFDRDANHAGERGVRRLAALLATAGAGERLGILTVPAPHNDLNAWAVARGQQFEAELAKAWDRMEPLAVPESVPTPARVRAAVREVVEWHRSDGGLTATFPAEAVDVLRRAPALPGRFGAAVCSIAEHDPTRWAEPVAQLRQSLGEAAPDAPHAANEARLHLHRLASARDAALDRALVAALRPGGADLVAAHAWAGVHDRAVDRLLSVSAADIPAARPEMPPAVMRGTLAHERRGIDLGW